MSELAPTTAVTGACGLLGTHVCEALAAAGHRVVALDTPEACREDDAARGALPSVVRGTGAEPIPIDPVHGPPPDVLEGVDRLIHAGLLRDPALDPERLEAVNGRGTAALLQACRDAGVERVVVIGSGEAYAPCEGPAREEAALAPQGALERSLLAAERAALESEAPAAIVLRAGAVYGPRVGAGSGAWPLALARSPVAAWPRNLGGRLPLVHARDVARAAIHLALLEQVPERLYNVAGEATLTARDAVRLVALYSGNAFVDLPPLPRRVSERLLRGLEELERAAGRWLPFGEGRPRAPVAALRGLARDLVLDTERLAATGFELEVPEPRRGIRDTLCWYKQEGWL